MTPEAIAGLAVMGLVLGLALRVPVGIALTLAGAGGLWAVSRPAAVWHTLGASLIEVGASHALSVLPLFVLMGAIATRSGMSGRLFDAASAAFARARGSESLATIGAAAAFGAVSGSSLATTATISKVAAPGLRARGYADALIGGTIAAGGTLGILIPPSLILVIYALVTGQAVAELFAAAILPGLVLTGLYLGTVTLLIRLRPSHAPPPEGAVPGRLRRIAGGWEVALLFAVSIGGIYAGLFTPTEAAAVGAVTALVIAVARRRIDATGTWEALRETAATTAALFLIVFGATVFAYFIVQARLPNAMLDVIAAWELAPTTVLIGIIVFYLVAGCIMDGIGMMLATVPVFFPVVTGLGFDPVWFGILLVVAVEVGLITPPLGMNIFVIRAQVPDLSLAAIYAGVWPFVLAQLVLIAALFMLPELALWLPGALYR